MAKILVDIEADGPCPGLYSMVSFGAVHLTEDGIGETFYGQTAPLPDAKMIPEALAVSGHSMEEHATFASPLDTMTQLNEWLTKIKNDNGSKRLFFISDNNGFDWQYINYYFWLTLGTNPFGHSSSNLNDLYKGMQNNMHKNFKHLRKTKHTHHPVDDATGNAEALQAMRKMGLKMKL